MHETKVIVVGVTGGIAAYKTAELVSRLVKKGYEIHVIMTKSAQHFVSPLTFRTLSGNPVITDLFAEPGSWNVQHISLAEKADIMAVVPATANIIGKIVNGIADDMLSTTIMAATCPVIIAPAMNVNMYQNPILQRNINKLKNYGYHFVEPGIGHLACGTEGKGRLAEIPIIEEAITRVFSCKDDFKGKKVLVTAGPTRETIDPVRFISNRSTGKMGYELAAAAKSRGADVYLVAGPTELPDPAGVNVTKVVTAVEMYHAVLERFSQADIVIKAAAVADYRPKEPSACKIKKNDGELQLVLERNPDILWELGKIKENQILVGFAAETEKLIEYAKEKIYKKNLDMIVANNITREGSGFGGTTNIVTIITRNEEIKELPKMTKMETAHAILDEISAKLKMKQA
ncbi:MAG: bifunctional phosphopantothenoylcysteine decarboxylase/phosphopantothenate--cysteine ligase CoaBC [Bacillota bacterium]|jgi:phosphopantothenoylcysteine decarboxylase/phosphopantothenate--cysteine ligase